MAGCRTSLTLGAGRVYNHLGAATGASTVRRSVIRFKVSDSSRLVWSGEHWMIYLRRPGEQSNSGSLSLYHTRHSPAGEGTLALVSLSGQGGFSALCTDNREVAKFVADNIVSWAAAPFDRDLPVLDAEVQRGGDVRTSPSWTVRTDKGAVVATWSNVDRPLVLERPDADSKGRTVTFSLLFFTDQGTITLDGRAIDGEPYTREDWTRSIGRPGSSSCFALAETETEPI